MSFYGQNFQKYVVFEWHVKNLKGSVGEDRAEKGGLNGLAKLI